MRIITGILKGRILNIPKGLSVRPTSDRTKESMFSILETHLGLRNRTILDLFAGSGNLGFEAISRGASKVVAVEKDRSNTELIEKTADKFKIANLISVRKADVANFLRSPAIPFDIVFADPPYNYPQMEEMIELITQHGWLKRKGWLLLEHDKRHDFTNHEECIMARSYGRTIVSIFEPAEKNTNS